MFKKWTKLVVLILVSRGLAMALTAVSGVLFARILGPEKIGLSAIVVGALNLGNLLVNLIQAPALVYEFKVLTTPEERARLLAESSALRLLIAAPFALLAPVVLNLIYPSYQLGAVAWYLAPMILLTACNPLWLYQALEKQGIQALLALWSPACTLLLSLALVRGSSGVGTDLWVTLVSLTLATALSWWWIFRKVLPTSTAFSLRVSSKMKQLLRSSRWLVLAAGAGYFYLSFEEQLIGYLCSPGELGTYRTAKISADAVNSFFTVASVLLFPRFIEWRRQGGGLLVRRIGGIAMAFIVCGGGFVVMAIFSVPIVHPLVFGEQYHNAVIPCIILLSAKCVVLISNVFSWALLAAPENYRPVALVMLFSSALSLFSNFTFIPRYGMVAAAFTSLACEAINLVCYFFLFRREAREHADQAVATIAPAGLGL
jgi:O-antigen/teichoic acid export membrane protein